MSLGVNGSFQFLLPLLTFCSSCSEAMRFTVSFHICLLVVCVGIGVSGPCVASELGSAAASGGLVRTLVIQDVCASFPGVEFFAEEASILSTCFAFCWLGRLSTILNVERFGPLETATCICRSGISNFLENDPGARNVISVVGRHRAAVELEGLVSACIT